jgi:hemerythrin superfamily protein
MGRDVTTLLTEDHREVDAIFQRLEQRTSTGAERAADISTVLRELSVHATAEEMVLYPHIRRHLIDGDALVDRALDEHHAAKELLAALDGHDSDDPVVEQALRELITTIRQHVAEEEGVLFAALRAHASEAELEALGRKLELAKKAAPTRPHPNAPNTPPGNLIVGLPTAVLDRLRDALSRP